MQDVAITSFPAAGLSTIVQIQVAVIRPHGWKRTYFQPPSYLHMKAKKNLFNKLVLYISKLLLTSKSLTYGPFVFFTSPHPLLILTLTPNFGHFLNLKFIKERQFFNLLFNKKYLKTILYITFFVLKHIFTVFCSFWAEIRWWSKLGRILY